MRDIAVIKWRDNLKKRALTVPVDDDLAVTSYQAFAVTGRVYAQRVTTPEALDAMRAIVDDLKANLDRRQTLLKVIG